jgi:hypothetical protein
MINYAIEQIKIVEEGWKQLAILFASLEDNHGEKRNIGQKKDDKFKKFAKAS